MAETIYEKAAKIIAERKEERRFELKRRRSEVFSKIPRLLEIETQLDRFGIRMLNLLASGECDETRAVSGIMAENKEYVKEREHLLSVHGFPQDYLDVKPACQKCGDSGFDDDKICECLRREITSIALKEANESYYWIKLLNATDYLNKSEYDSLITDIDEIISLLVSITKTIKYAESKEKSTE